MKHKKGRDGVGSRGKEKDIVAAGLYKMYGYMKKLYGILLVSKITSK